MPRKYGTLGRMSPVSRGRKNKRDRKATRRAAPLTVIGPPSDECDCPACNGTELDPQEMVEDLLASAGALLKEDDPIAVELIGAAFSTLFTFAGDADEAVEAASLRVLSMIAGKEAVDALAVLLALASVADGPVGEAATAGVARLRAAGIAPPNWAGELEEPVLAADCQVLRDATDTASMLSCVFHRAGRSHGVVVFVDEEECGAAADILLLDAPQVPAVLEIAQRQGGRPPESLDPAEFRWQVERALDARAVHDAEDGADLDEDQFGDDDGPGYLPLSVLLRARMKALPAPTKPPAPHGTAPHGQPVQGDSLTYFTLAPGGSRARGGKLPAKRKKSDGPAPIYQIKVTLRGAKPPIWRRLEVAGDITLAALHDALQASFEWDYSHLHVFSTPYGEFGMPDNELGYRSERAVTLEQVAASVGSRIKYTYDFGDDWEHEIQVEKIIDRDPNATYPRCTGGRRAAPPEDCGGVWGYMDLIEALTDPNHPDHQDRMDWMGLDDPSDFDPARFDPAEVTRALAGK